nr:uncharacterized protein LOC122271093 [Parasteatoda tepidariorum]
MEESTNDNLNSSTQDNVNLEVNKVAVKPPIFWRHKPKLWFLQLEAQFANGNITRDLTKYNIVVASLDENVLDFVEDILLNPPMNGKYDALKNALLSRLTDSEEARLKKVLTTLNLGDKRPSDLLRQMKGLAENSISEELLKSLWLQRLPQQVQAILSISSDSLDKMAEMADKIIGIFSSTELCTVDKVSSKTFEHNNISNEKFNSLEISIAELTKKFDTFITRSRPQDKSVTARDRSRSRSQSSRYKLCWYHFKFGNKAHRCVKPCQFQKPTNTSEN